MNMPGIGEEEKKDLSISYHFIYGFLTLLGICILFSLAKAIYHFYKKRAEHKNDIGEDSTNTESRSESNASPKSEKQPENNVSESDKLNVQLDKLRRLLNRLNAMGTFSRDTIGDLSEQSAANLNNSIEVSSDMSEFWSSIDFDEFEDSAINGSNIQNTIAENSISVSDFSLDTSGIHFNNISHNNMHVPPNMCVSKASQSQTNPSEAIAQILAILDSMMLKNRLETQSSEKDELHIESNTNESVIKYLSQCALSEESNVPHKKLVLSSSLASLDKTLTSLSKSMNSTTLINIPESQNSKTLNSGSKKNTIDSKLKMLENIVKDIESKFKTTSAVSMEAKMSKGMSVVNITLSSGSKNLIRRLSSSSKSIDARKLSLSRSVAICIDPNQPESTKNVSISESAVLSKEFYLKKNKVSKNVSVKAFQRKHPCTLEALNRTHSLSSLLAKKLPLQSIQPCFLKSCNNITEYEESNPVLITNTEHGNEISVMQNGSKDFKQTNVEVHSTKSVNCKELNNKEISRFKSLQTPLATTGSLKLSVSESDIKQAPLLGFLSPNLTPSNSEVFLSPVIAENISSRENIDWKSPVELISGVYSSQNFTPDNENANPPINLRAWSTPPSPK